MANSLRLSNEEITKLLAAWSVGCFVRATPQAGTANPATVVVTEIGKFFLKQRNPRYCDSEQIVYDHVVVEHLAGAGLPVTPALPTSQGRRWTNHSGHIYELYPFVAGDPHAPGDLSQIAAAGRLLARFHDVTSEFRPQGEKNWGRYFDPVDRLNQIGEARQLLVGGADTGAVSQTEAAAILNYLEAQVEDVIDRLPDERYWRLPQVIVHGDYHQGNMRFSGPELVGLFDFDWVGRQPRLVDIVDGLLFLGSSRREAIDPADIYSLTQSFEFCLPRMRAFLQPYIAEHRLSGKEWLCLVDLMRARWLFSRLEQMQRKIPPQQRLTFLLREVTRPLEWLDENEALVAGGAWVDSQGSSVVRSQ